jgi:preprotein translocase subunit SecF
MFDFIRHRQKFYFLSLFIVVASLVGLFFWGLNLGIDFKGGSSLYFEYQESVPTIAEVREGLSDLGLGDAEIRTAGEKGIMIQSSDEISDQLRSEVALFLGNFGDLTEGAYEYESISGMISRELTDKTRQAVILSLLAILLYVSWAFSKIYRPVPSWQYGLAALVALFFDVLVMLGIFVVLGRFAGAQINIPIVTALLIIFGYSVNDSVVVFDRIRENLLKGVGRDYGETVNFSLNQSLGRSLKTSFTTILVLLFLVFLGGSTLYFFALALIVGIVSGTYSSLFIASPLLVDAYQRKIKKS